MCTSSNCRSVLTSTSRAPSSRLSFTWWGYSAGTSTPLVTQRPAVERHDLLEVRRLRAELRERLRHELLLVCDRERRVVRPARSRSSSRSSCPCPALRTSTRRGAPATPRNRRGGSGASRAPSGRSRARPSAWSIARSVRATSPTNRLSPLSTAHGSGPRLLSINRNAVCSGRCPGVWRARTSSEPSRSSKPSAKGSWS